jgi:hypothetical protein
MSARKKTPAPIAGITTSCSSGYTADYGYQDCREHEEERAEDTGLSPACWALLVFFVAYVVAGTCIVLHFSAKFW